MSIDKFDGYTHADFVHECITTEFDGMDEANTFFQEYFPLVYAFIAQGKPFYLCKNASDSDLSRVESLTGNLNVKLIVVVNGMPQQKVFKLKLDKFLETAVKNNAVEVYSNLCCKPRDHNLKPREFNLWDEFISYNGECDKDTEELLQDNNLKQLIDFIKDIICSGNENHFNYLITWLKHIMEKPWEKTEICFFLQSEQGCGKGNLTNFLRKHVFGLHCSGLVCGLRSLTQKHNSIVANKSFMVVDELPATSDDFHGQFDTMKHLITEDSLSIEPKGKEIYEIDNNCNFMMSGNNLFSLKIEESDRRYACFQVSNSRRGDKPYWDNLCNNVLTAETGLLFTNYLLSFNKQVNLKNIPDTNIRNELKNNSKSSSLKYIDDLVLGEYDIPNVMFMPTFKTKNGEVKYGLTSKNLYLNYKDYCQHTGERCMKLKVFANIIQTKMSSKMYSIKGKKARLYDLGDIEYSRD